MAKTKQKDQKSDPKQKPQDTPETPEAETGEETEAPQTPETPAPEPPREPEVDYKEKFDQEHDARLRLAAEYDNFRKRTTREKEQSYGNGKSDAIAKILPIYDNLERAMNSPTEDAAYKKGVEMTFSELVKILTGLGVEIFGQEGDPFDPALHNAVMHDENADAPENTVTRVFQKGFRLGDKIIRFAMVQVAN